MWRRKTRLLFDCATVAFRHPSCFRSAKNLPSPRLTTLASGLLCSCSNIQLTFPDLAVDVHIEWFYSYGLSRFSFRMANLCAVNIFFVCRPVVLEMCAVPSSAVQRTGSRIFLSCSTVYAIVAVASADVVCVSRTFRVKSSCYPICSSGRLRRTRRPLSGMRV
jgi:hypothetical protein